MNKPYKVRNLAFKKGVLSTVSTTPAGNGHDYLTVLKYALQLINVPYVDPCCPDELTAQTFPMRFNADSGLAEYFDGTAWVDTGL